jgi:hypothetical protein
MRRKPQGVPASDRTRHAYVWPRHLCGPLLMLSCVASGAPVALAASLGVLSGLGVNIATGSIRHEPGQNWNPADYRYLHRFRTEIARSGFVVV